jgi:RNA polymerase sigma-70 factor, ECF subfamily
VSWRLFPGRQPDAAGFERVVLPHLDSAHNVARWLVRDQSLAEDVVQDAMLRALKYYAGFRGGDARPWLLQIVRNVAYQALARQQQRAETSFEAVPDGDAPTLDPPDPADDPETALGRLQDLQRLDQALASLAPELRECLVLKELEELSYKEIAEVTGVPIGTVMSRLWRARQSLVRWQTEGCEA